MNDVHDLYLDYAFVRTQVVELRALVRAMHETLRKVSPGDAKRFEKRMKELCSD